MKYRRLIIGAILGLTLVSPVAYAEGQILSDAQLSLVRANCLSAQSTMMRLHANDALARVHLGQEYETISTKLMTPMNSRVVLDKYDGSEMIKTAANFSAGLDKFRNLYQKYDQSITKVVQIKCTEQSATFLDVLTEARDYRQAVRDSVVELGDMVQLYRTQVADLKTHIKSLDSSKEGA